MGAEESMSPEEREKRNRLEDEAVDTGERARYNQQRARSEEGRSEVLDSIARRCSAVFICDLATTFCHANIHAASNQKRNFLLL
jgi:hypothetical protein